MLRGGAIGGGWAGVFPTLVDQPRPLSSRSTLCPLACFSPPHLSLCRWPTAPFHTPHFASSTPSVRRAFGANLRQRLSFEPHLQISNTRNGW